MSPQNLGPYALRDVLGRGGMGTVYRGVEIASGKEVAVKVLSPTYAADSSFRERFEAEIRSLEKLRHPNIVQLYGYGEQEGHLFYAMELVRGTSLQDELHAGRRFQWREVIAIGVEVCKALKHAHDHGVIHRDIKPANLLLTPDDRIKLSDFGIAKLFGNTQLTASGGVLGTADYMSPEQAEGLATTYKCDLYSLGGVLYALLAGRPPFQGKSVPEVIHKVRFDPPAPVRRLAADVPAELELVLEQLLAKDPTHRIPTALALANRLQAIQQALSIQRDTLEQSPASDASQAAVARAGAGEVTSAQARIAALETAPMDVDAPDPSVAAKPSSDSSAENSAVHGGRELTMAPNASAVDHFTTVEDARRHRLHDDEAAESLWLRGAKLLSLLAAILLVGGMIWQLRKPPTADELYARITAAVESESGEKLLREEAAVGQFLKRFSHDERVDAVLAAQEGIKLERFQRQLERQSRRRDPVTPLTPAEQILLQAMQLEPLDPILATKKLQGLIDVFGNDPEAPSRDRQIVRLAERRLRRVQRRTVETAELYLQVLRLRLQYASQIQQQDSAQAIRIVEGIVRLYADSPWAAEVVAEAGELMQRLKERAASVGQSRPQ